jgi:hypothetical protein
MQSQFKSTAGFYSYAATSGAFVSMLVPMLAHGQTIQAVLTQLSNIMGLLIPMALAAALLAFFWGLAKFLFSSGEDTEGARKIMINGVLALFVMVSIWGIVALLQKTLGISSITRVPAPTITGQAGGGSFAPNIGN